MKPALRKELETIYDLLVKASQDAGRQQSLLDSGIRHFGKVITDPRFTTGHKEPKAPKPPKPPEVKKPKTFPVTAIAKKAQKTFIITNATLQEIINAIATRSTVVAPHSINLQPQWLPGVRNS